MIALKWWMSLVPKRTDSGRNISVKLGNLTEISQADDICAGDPSVAWAKDYYDN